MVNKQESSSSVGIQTSCTGQRICFSLYGTPSWNDKGSTEGNKIARIMNERNNQRVHSAAALLAVQQSDPESIKRQRLQNDVAMNLVARTQIKNELDRCNATRMKLEMLQNSKDAMVAKY